MRSLFTEKFYLGCYNDAKERVLTGLMEDMGKSCTPYKCTEHCKKKVGIFQSLHLMGELINTDMYVLVKMVEVISIQHRPQMRL